MSIGAFDKTFEEIERNKKIKDSGGFNSIPFGIPALDRHVPGIMRGTQYIITANSGVGKTQLTKFLFVNQAYKFVKENPRLGIKLKIIYFAHEESETEFMRTLICNRMKEVYNRIVTPMQLTSMGGYHLSDEDLACVRSCREYFKELEQSVEIIDYISNPTGMYKHVRQFARENGTFYFKGRPITNQETDTLYDTYIQTDPNLWVIVIGDHISLTQPERSEDAATSTLHGAITKWSAEYCRKRISKKFSYSVVNVQQQASDKEKLQFTNSGQSIESKLEPSLDGLGDCKLTQRDAMVVLGLFGPDRYEIKKHLGYDVTIMQDNYRSLSILKNRFGTPNLKMGLYFDGATNRFKQLPEVGSEELIRIYENLKRGIK